MQIFRHAIAVLGLVAIALQIFAVQLHVHARQVAVLSPAIAAHFADGGKIVTDLGDFQTGSMSVPTGNFPAGDDTSNCPLCQAFSQSGAFVAGGASFIAPVRTADLNVVSWTEADLPAIAGAHIWRSRAPPIRSVQS